MEGVVRQAGRRCTKCWGGPRGLLAAWRGGWLTAGAAPSPPPLQGYFIVDVAAGPNQPVVLFNIPDGSVKSVACKALAAA